MSVIGEAFTLQDLATRLDSSGNVAKSIDVVGKSRAFYDDILWKPCNEERFNDTHVLISLPKVNNSAFNIGAPSDHAGFAQVRDECAMMLAYVTIDARILQVGKNRLSGIMTQESRAKLEAMSQFVCGQIFYGDRDAEGNQINGLAKRYGSLGTGINPWGVRTSERVISAGGTENLTSIYLIRWHEDATIGIFPQNTGAGFKIDYESKEVTERDNNNNKYPAIQAQYQWYYGLAIPDPRWNVRACNINFKQLTKNGATGANLVDLMQDMIDRVESTEAPGRYAFYANRDVVAFLRKQVMTTAQYQISTGDLYGRHNVTMFGGIPVRKIDEIKCGQPKKDPLTGSLLLDASGNPIPDWEELVV